MHVFVCTAGLAWSHILKVCVVGNLGGCVAVVLPGSAWHVGWGSSWYCKNEVSSTRLCVVARTIWGLEYCAVKECVPCQGEQKVPASSLTDHVHVDCAGPFMGRMFLVMVDAHWKWPEVVSMSYNRSSQTIVVVRQVFSAFGLQQESTIHWEAVGH